MGLVNYYNYIVEETCDQRTKDRALVHSPLPILVILCGYYYLVHFYGPNYMKNRDAYSLKTFIKCYNIFQIITNAILVYGTVAAGPFNFFGCVPMNHSLTGEGYTKPMLLWWAYMLKLIDLTETIVFILRKKTNQVSFLHVYHHISTPIVTWMQIKWMPGGMQSLFLIVNCGVHVIMYTYYLLSAENSTSQKLAKWIKPWITIIQMAQFCIMLAHTFLGLLPSCETHKFIMAVTGIDVLYNFYLFHRFYKKSYTQQIKQKTAKD